jgi:hypothetical protein
VLGEAGMTGAHVALDMDDSWLVLHATSIDAEMLVRVCQFIGVVEE